MIPRDRGIEMLAKDNITIGIVWGFGPEWPGQRYGAKTRRGTACQRPANKKNGRCRLHGGRSTGPKSAEGRSKIAKRREDAKLAKRLRDWLRVVEKNLKACGVIDLALGWLGPLGTSAPNSPFGHLFEEHI